MERNFLKITFFHLMILFFSFLFYACHSTDKGNHANISQSPNIIYILADDLGYGDLGCYGQQEIRTPNIDELANEGIRFTAHYAGSTVCAPSRCALMTGMHTGHARIRGNADIALLPDDVTMAELLQDAGYITAIFGKWGLGEFGSTGHPNDQGFDYFVGYLNQIRAHNAYPDWIWDNKDTLWLDNEVDIIPETYAKGIGSVATKKNTHTQDVFTEKALKFLETHKDSTFFLYLPYTLPHANNEAWYYDKIGMEVPDMMGYDTISRWDNAQQAFAAAISYLDRDVGKIMAKLNELGLAENTLVIFTSDNGPHKEGGNDPEISHSSGPLRGMKRDLYEGGIRVPMITWWPGTIKKGRTSDHVSAFWDVLPTFCEVAGIEKPDIEEGLSFLPELLGTKQPVHDYLYWEFHEQGGKQAVRFDNWKGVRLSMSDNRNANIELYNLATDIAETDDVSKYHPHVVAKMDSLMDAAHTYSSEFSFIFEKKSP